MEGKVIKRGREGGCGRGVDAVFTNNKSGAPWSFLLLLLRVCVCLYQVEVKKRNIARLFTREARCTFTLHCFPCPMFNTQVSSHRFTSHTNTNLLFYIQRIAYFLSPRFTRHEIVKEQAQTHFFELSASVSLFTRGHHHSSQCTPYHMFFLVTSRLIPSPSPPHHLAITPINHLPPPCHHLHLLRHLKPR